MARLLVRNVFNNRWLDSCKQPMYVRSLDNRSWIQLDPKKMRMRDGANSEFLENDCSYNPMFDDACAFMLLNSVNCPQGIPVDELGSGDGTGSRGSTYDRINGYPPGYDMPDAGDSGFELVRDEATAKGWALKRPALNYVLESYDEGGTTPSYGRGNWANPNYLGSSTFSGGTQIAESIYDLGQEAGYVEVIFASYDTRGISVDVYYLGSRVATSCGFVEGRSKVEFYYDPALGEGEQRVMIRVRSSSDSTRWVYQTMGPKPHVLLGLDNTDTSQTLSLMTDEYNGTPFFPAPCHATVFPREYKTVDGKWFYEFHHVIDSLLTAPDQVRQMVLDYTSWLNADKFEVYHGGLRIASSMDAQQDLGMLQFTWNPQRFTNPVPDLMVRVTTSERQYGSDIMSWYYTLFCPDVIGYRAAPWPCDGAEVRSMGHSSTEDNFDLDNGVDPGVVSIKIIGFGNFEYVISVFDSNMDLIEAKVGTDTTFVQFFVNTEAHGNTRKRITVRVDCPLGEYWEYFVGCPIPVLDVELDDKTIPVCNEEVEIVVNDGNIPRGTVGKLTVQSSVPVANDITFDFMTVDGTAKSQASYGGLGSTYALTGPQDDVASLVAAELANSVMLFDASFYRLMNDNYKQGISSTFNVNNAVNSYSTLSNDAKATVNIFRNKLGSLNGKRWLVLAGHVSNDESLNGEWGHKSSNFLQSMRDIYGMTVTVVPFSAGVNFTTSSWHNALTSGANWDIITIADSSGYSLSTGQSIASIYIAGSYTGLAADIASRARSGTCLHFVLKAGTQDQNYRNNFLCQEILNQFPNVKVKFRVDKTNNKTPPYYVEDHLEEMPDSPFAQNVPTDGVFDCDLRQAWVTYERSTPATIDPDYVGRVGQATIAAGQMAVDITIETLTPAHNSVGRQFSLVISNASEGTIIDNTGIGTIVANTGGTVSDFNFTKSTFRATSYNARVGEGKLATVLTYGGAVMIGIGYSQVADNSRPYIEQAGKVAYSESSNPVASNVHGICASYPFDPARTYEYKWEATETFNDINKGNVVAKASSRDIGIGSVSEWSANNDKLFISIHTGHAYSSQGNRSTWNVFAYIRDDLGNVYKSNQLTVSLISTPV